MQLQVAHIMLALGCDSNGQQCEVTEASMFQRDFSAFLVHGTSLTTDQVSPLYCVQRMGSFWGVWRSQGAAGQLVQEEQKMPQQTAVSTWGRAAAAEEVQNKEIINLHFKHHKPERQQ